ncbi:Hypp5915 [Branchiostoma lanceolatum]|uniref:Hypp5915 protein n=1 Tax=Branchiostoma lanceolatum TaxID=7740 RepID=A0A8J9W4U4_BRALA|nr:Hypp5915 [Branchiostoma lanceolatum]
MGCGTSQSLQYSQNKSKKRLQQSTRATGTDSRREAQLLAAHPELKKAMVETTKAVEYMRAHVNDEEHVESIVDLLDKNIYSHYLELETRTQRMLLGNHLAKIGAATVFTEYIRFLKQLGYFSKKLWRNDVVWICTDFVRQSVVNCTDSSPKFGHEVVKAGLAEVVLDDLDNFANKDDNYSKVLVASAMHIIYNCSRVVENYELLNDLNAVPRLLPFLEHEDPQIQTITALTLAYITDKKNKQLVMSEETQKKVVSYILRRFREAVNVPNWRSDGFSALELASGIAQLATNDTEEDANKLVLVQEGVVPPLVKLMEHSDEEEQLQAVGAIWQLSFHEDNRKKILEEPGAVEKLKKLKDSPYEEISDSATGALYVLTGKGKDHPQRDSEEEDDTRRRQRHVMISYNWDHQKIAVKISKQLRRAGYRVWIDETNMRGSILEAMGEAVSNAAVVLVCVSRQYFLSKSCRAEGNACHVTNTPVIPIKVEKTYNPDGWLAVLVGAGLYFDFSEPKGAKAAMKGLVKEIGSRGKADARANDDDDDDDDEDPETDLRNWTTADVDKWMTEFNLKKDISGIAEITGAQLAFLRSLKEQAPEFFYQYLLNHMGITGLEQLTKFTHALDNAR